MKDKKPPTLKEEIVAQLNILIAMFDYFAWTESRNYLLKARDCIPASFAETGSEFPKKVLLFER